MTPTVCSLSRMYDRDTMREKVEHSGVSSLEIFTHLGCLVGMPKREEGGVRMFKNLLSPLLFCALLLSLTESSSFALSTFDHDYHAWDQVLDGYTKNGLVDYAALRKTPESLTAHFQTIRDVPRDAYNAWSRDQKIAFWINTYNAAAVQTVLNHYPLKKGLSWKALAFPANSIQQIPNVWDQKFIEVFGQKISLNHIEHEILRKEFQEPRIHFALVCASLGCPVLRDEPYVPERLDAQLDDQVARFLADAKKFRYDANSDTHYLSPIFKWFGEDFKKAGGIVSFLKVHLAQEIGEKLSDKTTLRWLDYDWSLNEKSPNSVEGGAR